MKRRAIAAVLCCVLMLAVFSGCGGTPATAIRMDIDGPVHNLDPQFATDPTARMILHNLFEGLAVLGADGRVRPGAAQSWQISPDGLTYTFTLREDARWQDASPLTAADFVFAFQRMFSPQTPSPFARDFLAIAGAREVLEGEANIEALGVRASGENTVVFTLARPSGDFLTRLTQTGAMPTNREAFEDARGRYGLEARYLKANGAFSLTRWDNARFLQLDRNAYFRESEMLHDQRVIFYIGRTDPVRQFLDGRSDLLLIPSDRLEQAGGGERIPTTGTTWALVFNQNAQPWNNTLLRQALALTLDYSLLGEHLPVHLSPAAGLIPPGLMAGERSFRETFGSALTTDPQLGRRLYNRGLTAIDQPRLPATSAFSLEDHFPFLEIAGFSWAGELGGQPNLAAATADQMETRRSGGDFGVLLLPFTAPDESPGSILMHFHSAGPQNRFGYNNPRFDHALEMAANAGDPEAIAGYFRLAEEILLEDAAVIPLFFETGYHALAEGLTGLEIFPFGGRIYFHYAQKLG